ncbi:MAG TPA: PAS domain S-box protein [Rhodanobacteraceae bacterium]|nr:PAS domain S-box protein [Rhodanobacteraceae bacterium]
MNDTPSSAGVSTDATSRVNADQSFMRLFRASPAPFLIVKPDAPRFTIVEVNDAYLAATMRTREQLIGRGIFEAYPDNPNDPAIGGVSALRASLERVLATRQPDILPGLKYDIARPDGTFEERWWSPINSAVLDENGEVEAIIHNANDVTGQYRAEAAARQSSAQLNLAVEVGGIGHWSLDLATRTLTTSAPCRRNFGRPEDEPFSYETLVASIHPDDRDRQQREVRAAIEARSSFDIEYRLITPAGETRWAAIRGRYEDGEHPRLVGVSLNITERKQADARQRESEERQAFLLRFSDALRAETGVEAMGHRAVGMIAEHLRLDRCWISEVFEDQGISMVGPEWIRPDLSPMAGVFQLSDYPETMRQLMVERMFVEDTAGDARFAGSEKELFAGLHLRALLVVPLREGERHVVWALAAAMAESRQWTDGERALLEDVAERTWAAIERARGEAALAASEEKYRTIFDSIDEGFALIEVVFDDEGKPVDLLHLETNPAYERHTGLRDVVGKRALEVAPDFDGMWFDFYGKVARTGEAAHTEYFVAAPVNRWFTLHASRVGGEGSRKIAVVFNDITERKHAEVALRESEKRQAFLLKLSDALRPLSDPLAIQEATSRVVQEHMNVDWARYSELDFERQIIFNTRDFGQNDRPSHVDEYDMRQFPVHAAAWRAGRSLAIDDVEADTTLSDGERNRLLKYGIRALLATPLTRNAMAVAVISVHSTVPRRWTESDIALLKEAADCTWEALERAHAETAQWDSETRYRHLFETIPVGFGVVEVLRDEDGKVADWFVREFNPALERYIGLDPTTTVDQRIRDILTGANLDESARLLQDVVDNRQSRYVEIHADKIGCWLAITASPLDGNHISLIFEDVTDRRQAEQARREREKRQAFLLKLGDALRAEFDPEAIGVLATHMLAEYMRIDRSYICRVSRDKNRAWIGPEYHASDMDSVAGEYRLDDFPALMRQLEAGPLVIHDLLNDSTCSDFDRQSIGAMGMQAIFTGMLRNGERNHVWALVVGHSRPRIWTDDDRMLIEAAAERTWAAVARARVEIVMHENEARYRSVVESATDGIWLADHDGRFIEVNAAGCRMLGYSPEQYRQLGIRDLVHPNEAPRLRRLVETLEQGGQSTDTWRICHADGHYVPIESSQCFTPAGYWQIIGRDVSERQRIEHELQQRSEQFVTLLRESPMGVYLIDQNLCIRVINPAAREAGGGDGDLAGCAFDSAMRDVWSHDFADELVWHVRRTLATGESYFTPERPERRGGDTAWYAWHIHRTAIPGNGDGVVCYLSDVTNQVRARERQKLLLMEVNHRVKNTLATVQSIVAQTLHNATTLDEGAAALESRLISLSSAHNVLVREHWEGGDLHEVVRNTLAAYPEKAGASRFRVNGIDVRLQPKAVVTLSMALHELATNAVKYGALSKAHGYVDIAWEVDDGKTSDRRFRLRWSEHDGPPVRIPENRGFGSRLIERGLAMDMGGEAHLDFDPTGLVCTIDAPLDEISGEARWD